MKLVFNGKGQTLLETVFALGILLLVISAILGLVTANVAGQRHSESALFANNLAREGIEVVRGIRDSNWLAGNAWNLGLSGSNAEAIPVFNYNNGWQNSWSVDFEAVNSISDERAMVYLSTQAPIGVYNQNGVGAGQGEATIFRRILLFKNICINAGIEEIVSAEAQCGSHIGYEVTALVEWRAGSGERSIKLTDLLYAWK